MAEEAKVRVRLDTRLAQQALHKLTTSAKRTAGRIGGTVRGELGRGLGLGAGVGAGLAAVRGATQSGISDVAGEALGGFGAQLEEFFLGDLVPEARSSRAAREDTIAAFGMQAGAINAIPPGAKNYFDQVKALRYQEEEGARLFRQSEDFRGPGVGELIDRILTALKQLLDEAVEALVDKLAFWKNI